MNSFIAAMSIVVHAYRSHSTAAQRERWMRTLAWTFLCGVAFYMVLSSSAWAATSPAVGGQTADFSLFDSLDTDAKTRSNTWFDSILQLVRPTFLILATIEICWAAAIWAFERDNLNSLAVEIVKKIMFFGFFFALLQFAPQWIPTITATFQQVGETASGTGPVTTDAIIATGLALIKMVWSHAPTGLFGVLGKLGEILVACFVTLGIVIAYVVLAAQYFTLKIESYILFAAGAIFLGLGSSSWTKEYVSKYLNYAINVGVRLLVLILVLSLLLGTVTEMGNSFSFNFEPLLKLLAVAILQAILGIKAPEMAGALLNGGVGMSAGSAMGAAASGIGGLKGTIGMAAATIAKVASTGQGVANAGRAVGAGRDVAKQQGKSGAAAGLSGLGIATAQAAKLVPGKLMDAIKGKGSGHRAPGGGGGAAGGRGQSPGLFDLTKQKLQSRAPGAGGGGSGASLGSDSSSGGSTSSAASAVKSSSSSSDSKTSSTSSSSSSKSDSPATGSLSRSDTSTSIDSAATLVNADSGGADSPSASAPSNTTAKSTAPSFKGPSKLRKATAPNFSRPLPSHQTPKPTKDL